MSRRMAGAVIVAAMLSLCALVWRVNRHTTPYSDGEMNLHWVPYGGAWELTPEGIRNNSDERGAKLLTGSTTWTDYSVQADVALLGDYGDSGLIVRATDPEQGVDAYRGYFAGLRTLDNALIFGGANYGWKQYRAIRVPGDVQARYFYHMQMMAVGCRIAVRVDLPGQLPLIEAVELKHCVPSGQAGLKSFQSPGMWRNVRIRPATGLDMQRLIGDTPIGRSSEGTLLRHSDTFNELEPLHKEALNRRLEGSILPIGSVQLEPLAADQTVFLRGVVRLNRPLTFVEDATGGIEVITAHPLPLTIGEDVEIAGKLQLSRGRPRILAESVKELGSSDAAAAPLVSPEEVATGRVDGRTVVVIGDLIRREKTGVDGDYVLLMKGNGEVFRVLAQQNPFVPRQSTLRVGSRVEVVGVALTDTRYAGDSAFALLAPSSNESIRVLSGPPLLSVENVIGFAVVLLSLVTGASLLYVRVRHNYLAGLTKEREVLAHDLHDTVSQSFAGIGFQLNAIGIASLPEGQPRRQFERALAMIHSSHDELRRSIAALRTELRSSSDLRRALEGIAQTRVQGGSLLIRAREEGNAVRLPARLADAFFRIGQEAISNSIHHAKASYIEITTVTQRDMVAIYICDDGCGLPESGPAKGSGLYGMRRRAEMAGAKLQVESSGVGTVVRLEARLRYTLWERLLFRHLTPQTRWNGD